MADNYMTLEIISGDTGVGGVTMSVGDWGHISGVTMMSIDMSSGTSYYSSRSIRDYDYYEPRIQYVYRDREVIVPVYRDREVIKYLPGITVFQSGQTVYVERPIIKEVRVMDYTSLGFILAVMVICVITVKFILPHVTLKNVMWGVVRLIVWPFKKAYQAANREWKDANRVPKKGKK